MSTENLFRQPKPLFLRLKTAVTRRNWKVVRNLLIRNYGLNSDQADHFVAGAKDRQMQAYLLKEVM